MRLADYEAVELSGGRVAVRWTAGERLRRAVFGLLQSLVAGGLLWGGLRASDTMTPTALYGVGIVLACLAILYSVVASYGRNWVFDPTAGTIRENGRQRATFAEIRRFMIKRERRSGTAGGNSYLVYLFQAEFQNEDEPLLIAEMDQGDAHHIGRTLASSLRIPLSER